ncbi:hypothetical protein AAW12_20425 [Sphingobacterium sp. Ag1]|nr:hypothetical protein AAW12_20425 [Sphingobacterium sp. Ag1]
MRYSLVFLVFLLSTLLMKGIAMPSHSTVQHLPLVRLSLSTLQAHLEKGSGNTERENLVAAVKDHDFYDITEQMDLKDEWSKLLYWGVLSICLFVFCYPVCLKIQNNRRPYMDRLILPPKYILFQSLKIPFLG